MPRALAAPNCATLRPVFTVKELRAMAARLSVEQFVKQRGPFALGRSPPPRWLRAQGGDENPGVARPAMAKAADISTNILSLLFESDGLSINITPPLSS